MAFRFTMVGAFLAMVLIAGCGGDGRPGGVAYSPQGSADPQTQKAGGGEKAAAAPVGDAAIKAPVAPAERKIIYTASIELIVKELDDVLPQIEKLISSTKDAYIAKSEVRVETGSRRTASYSLRVPVNAFPTMRESLIALGNPERNAIDSQDVTEEFVDIQARLKNLKEQEDKLNDLLKEKRKEEKLEDIIKVSDRIAEVRRDAERVQGRLNYLSNLTALATINLTVREVKDYKPPTAPTFGDRIGSTFGTSWNLFVGFCEGIVLMLVGLSAWLPILLPLGILGFFVIRKIVRVSRVPKPSARLPIPSPPV